MAEFDDSVFGRSQDRFVRLQTALPQGALENLARAVVHRMSTRPPEVPNGNGADLSLPDAGDIDLLCTALIAPDPDEARGMMVRLQKEGVGLDRLYARYLAPAAARLGEMWDDSELSFAGVTLGVGRIHDLVRLLRDRLPEPRITRADPVLFASVPGDQHAVGLEMAAELFRQNGWDVRLVVNATQDRILGEIDSLQCLLLGLSSGGKATTEALARLVSAVRVAHPNLYILVSGRLVIEDPGFVGLLEPDSAVATVEEALQTMERLSAECPKAR